jgi:hypothetical protein
MSIAVDLDGTLAEYNGWEGNNIIGAPIPAMFFRVQRWIEEGEEVVIFTARADSEESMIPIRRWLIYHGLGDLRITNIKEKGFQEIYDDRAFRVERNTGCIEGTDWG